MRKKVLHENTEFLIELLQACLEEEGYETKRYSESKKYSTSAYDCIAVKGIDGKYYDIMVSECTDTKNPHTGKTEKAAERYIDI